MLLAEAWIDSLGDTGQTIMHVAFGFVISLLSIFLILLVLVQRGRGGGLAGALGGMGGQSAFGTRAGDTFTWITYGTAAVWIFLAMVTIKTFTDPVQDKKDMIAETQEKSEEDATFLPRGVSDDADMETDRGADSDADAPPDAKPDDSKSDDSKSDDAARAKDSSIPAETPESGDAKPEPPANKEAPPSDAPTDESN